MNLDFSELSKGINQELEQSIKLAGVERFIGPTINAAANVRKGGTLLPALKNFGGWAANNPIKATLGAAAVTHPTATANLVSGGVHGAGQILGLAGDVGQGVGDIVETGRNIGGLAMDVGRDMSSGAQIPGASASGAPEGMLSSVNQFVKNLRGQYQQGGLPGMLDYAWGKVKPQVTGAYDKATELAKNYLGEEIGKYAVPGIAGIGGIMLLSSLLGKKKNRSMGAGGQGGQPININIGGGRPMNALGTSPTGVSSLADLSKYSSLNIKQADIVTSSIANALKQRMANKVIDRVLPGTTSQTAQDSSTDDKEIELVSEYPEIQKILKDDENKAYLKRLLKEQS